MSGGGWRAEPAAADPGPLGSADAAALAKAREAYAAPSRWGHSDLGDMLLRYLAGEVTLAYFLWFADVTYLGVTGVPAPLKTEDEA